MDIRDWTVNYIEYLNSYKKTLESKKLLGNKIECKYSDRGVIKYVIDETLENCKYDDNTIIVCLNTNKNLKTLIQSWKEYVKHQKLKIIFVNPDLNLQWSIIPYLHHKYNEESSLEKGLKSLFSSVPSV